MVSVPHDRWDKADGIAIEDYLAGEVAGGLKHECLGGVVHAMAGGSNQHNALATNALGFLLSRLRGRSCRPFNSDTKVRIEYPDHTRFYYPYAMVVCHPNHVGDHFQDHPVVVVVEVLSDSTRRTDLGEKRDAYLRISSLKVLMFVEREAPEVLHYRGKAEGGVEAAIHTGLDAEIPLPEIEISLPLAELYERVELV